MESNGILMGVKNDVELFRKYAEEIRNEYHWGHVEISEP